MLKPFSIAAVAGVDADVAQERLRHAEHHDVADPVEDSRNASTRRRVRLGQERPVRLARTRAPSRRRRRCGRGAWPGAAPAGAASPQSSSPPSATSGRRRRRTRAASSSRRPRPPGRTSRRSWRPGTRRCACPRTAPALAGPAPAGRSRRRRCRASRAGSRAPTSADPERRRVAVARDRRDDEHPETEDDLHHPDPGPQASEQVDDRAPEELERTSRCAAPEVIETCGVRGADGDQELEPIWWRKLQGSPSPKYVVEVHSRSFLDFGVRRFATVQRWSSARTRRRQFFPGAAQRVAARRTGPRRYPVDARSACLVFDRNENENAFQNQLAREAAS